MPSCHYVIRNARQLVPNARLAWLWCFPLVRKVRFYWLLPGPEFPPLPLTLIGRCKTNEGLQGWRMGQISAD